MDAKLNVPHNGRPVNIHRLMASRRCLASSRTRSGRSHPCSASAG